MLIHCTDQLLKKIKDQELLPSQLKNESLKIISLRTLEIDRNVLIFIEKELWTGVEMGMLLKFLCKNT